MTTNLNETLTQNIQTISKIFVNKDAKLFLNKLLNQQDYWALLTNDEKQTIQTILKSMVMNARVDETRKQQQQFFYQILEALNQPNLKTQFDNSANFRANLITLSLIFLANLNEMTDSDKNPHNFVIVTLQKALKTILE